MAEGARLESVYTATYRGFESPPHRHIRDESLYESTGSFLLYSPQGGMRTPDRGSTTGAASWTDRARSKRAAPQGRAKRVNPPPHRHIQDESLYASTGSFLLYSPQGGMRTPDRGSTTGAASWTDRARSKRAAPQGRAKRVNPPPHRHIQDESLYASTGSFLLYSPQGGMRTPDRGSTTDHRHYAVLSKPDSSSHD